MRSIQSKLYPPVGSRPLDRLSAVIGLGRGGWAGIYLESLEQKLNRCHILIEFTTKVPHVVSRLCNSALKTQGALSQNRLEIL